MRGSGLAPIQQKALGVASYTFVRESSTFPAEITDLGGLMPVDLRLYAIVDPEHAGGRSLPELAKLIAAGGATLVQLRDKKSDTRAMVDTARALKAALKPFGVPLLINDRVDVALAAGADGVHIGQTDMAPDDARRLLGPQAIIGLSINTEALAEAAPIETLDYVGIGGVYATTSKDQKKPPIGVDGLRRIVGVFRRRNPEFPACAIAGINAANAGATIAAGADGVSVISALSLAADPAAAAKALRAVVDDALMARKRQ
jgi:thiamine-phosphate pyrophosphorylase